MEIKDSTMFELADHIDIQLRKLIKGDIIFTGSLVLKMFGLLDRPLGHDIDVIVVSDSRETKKALDALSAITPGDHPSVPSHYSIKIAGCKQSLDILHIEPSELEGYDVEITKGIAHTSVKHILKTKMLWNRNKDNKDIQNALINLL